MHVRRLCQGLRKAPGMQGEGRIRAANAYTDIVARMASTKCRNRAG